MDWRHQRCDCDDLLFTRISGKRGYLTNCALLQSAEQALLLSLVRPRLGKNTLQTVFKQKILQRKKRTHEEVSFENSPFPLGLFASSSCARACFSSACRESTRLRRLMTSTCRPSESL